MPIMSSVFFVDGCTFFAVLHKTVTGIFQIFRYEQTQSFLLLRTDALLQSACFCLFILDVRETDICANRNKLRSFPKVLLRF